MVDKARAFQRCVVHETVIRLVAKGEASAATLSTLTKLLAETLSSSRTSPIMDAAITEVMDVAAFVRALVDPGAVISLADINKICLAKTGIRQLICQAATQQAHFKKQLVQLRQCVTSLGVLKPELDDTLKKLNAEPSTAVIVAALNRIPVWQDSLRPGAHHMLSDSKLSVSMSSALVLWSCGDLWGACQ